MCMVAPVEFNCSSNELVPLTQKELAEVFTVISKCSEQLQFEKIVSTQNACLKLKESFVYCSLICLFNFRIPANSTFSILRISQLPHQGSSWPIYLLLERTP